MKVYFKIMARVISSLITSKRVKRPGVISKCKTSRNKRSRNYKKAYKGQGRV